MIRKKSKKSIEALVNDIAKGVGIGTIGVLTVLGFNNIKESVLDYLRKKEIPDYKAITQSIYNTYASKLDSIPESLNLDRNNYVYYSPIDNTIYWHTRKNLPMNNLAIFEVSNKPDDWKFVDIGSINKFYDYVYEIGKKEKKLIIAYRIDQ
ncbi:MAG: hypothetical protein QW524_01955 [Candidatus Woesearchaeota archaeon]